MLFENLAYVIAEMILSKTVGFIETRYQTAITTAKIAKVLDTSFHHVVDTYSYESLHIHLSSFLQHDEVQRELAKLILPYQEPRVDWLCQRWTELYGEPKANLILVFNELLRFTKVQLASISELIGILNLRTTLQIQHDLAEGVRSIRNEISALAAVSTPIPKEISDEVRYDIQLDICRSLYQDNRPSAAISQLHELENDLRGQLISNRIRFRMHTLIGSCALALEDTAQSIDRFEKAYNLQPQDSRAQANRALAYLLNGELEQSIQMAEMALTSEKSTTSARAVRVLALAAQRDYKNLGDLVDEAFFDDPIYVSSIGKVLLQARNYKDAEKYLRLCVSQNDKDIWSQLSLIEALLGQAAPEIEIGLTALPSIQHSDSLKEMDSLADNAVSQARLGDNIVLQYESLVESARVKALEGDPKGAIDNLEKILNEDPGYEPAIYNLGLVQMDYGNLQAAVDSFVRIPMGHRQSFTWQAMTWCYLSLERLCEARYALDQVKEFPTSLSSKLQNAHLLIKEGKITEAEYVRDELCTIDSSLSLRFAAYICHLLNENEKERQLLERGYHIASNGDKELLASELAIVFFQARDYTEALKWFGLSGPVTQFNRLVLRPFIGALFYSGFYQQAFQEAENARQRGIIDPVLLETQAWITEAVGDLNQASQLYETLRGLEPTDISHYIDKMRCKYLLGDIESVRKLLSELKLNGISDPTALSKIAELLALIGDHIQAVEVSYQALRLGGSIAAVHQTYIRLFLAYDHELNDLKPNMVGPDTAVSLKSDRGTRWVKILSTHEPRDRSEVAVSSSLASKLIGHAVGDIIQLRVGDLEELKYEVAEIQSVLLRAFQESLHDFGTLFPDNLQIQRAEIKDGDISSVLMQVARMGTRAHDILHIYKTGRVPLESASILLGHHRYDVQRGICMGGQDKFLCSDDTPPTEYTKILETTVITVDLSALVTLQLIGLLSKLTERFTPIYVPTQLLEELVLENDARRNWKSKTKHTLGFSDGHWQMTDIPKAVLDDDARRFEELLNYVQNACTALPVDIEHTGLMADPEGHMHVLGRATLATLLVAQQTETLLYTDDRALRALARHEYGCTGFWTFPLLSDLQQRSLITDEVFQDAVMQLILANYQYVPVSSEVLMRVIKSGMSIDSRTRKVMAVLTGVSSDETTAIQVAAKVLGDVYLDRDLRLDRTFVLHAILASLIAGRIPGRVLHKLLRRLAVILRVAPVQLSQLEVDIQDWQLVVAPTLTSSALGGLRPGS